jgi:HK97 gp10 family phage protein
MGKFDFQVDTDFLKTLGKLAEVEEIAPKMIDEAMPILEKNLKGEMINHKVTSDMIDSVKKTKAGKNKYGFFATVRPTGTGSNGVRNMEKLAYLEFGTSDQDPTPIITKAINDSKAKVESKMREVFEREVKK